MNNINPMNSYRPITPIANNPAQKSSAGTTKTPLSRADKVEISENAMYLSRMQQMPEVRQEKVEAIRTQINNGTYDLDSKLDVVADRLTEEYIW